MVGVDTNVDIPGIEAVVLRVAYWHEEGKDSEHQNNESNGKEFQEHPPILSRRLLNGSHSPSDA